MSVAGVRVVEFGTKGAQRRSLNNKRADAHCSYGGRNRRQQRDRQRRATEPIQPIKHTTKASAWHYRRSPSVITRIHRRTPAGASVGISVSDDVRSNDSCRSSSSSSSRPQYITLASLTLQDRLGTEWYLRLGFKWDVLTPIFAYDKIRYTGPASLA